MSESQSQQPSRTRHKLLYFGVVAALITYIDRVCMSQSIGLIQKDLGLNDYQKGYILSAFALAYSLFEVPTGWWGDLIGPRKVLTRVVVWWSVFTSATGFAWNYVSVLVIRFLFGAGEAGFFPNMTKAYTTWLPRSERSRAQGIVWLAARWGGALTPLLMAFVFWIGLTWRQAFICFGFMGVIWAFFFYRWYRDNPAEHPKINAAELALLEGAQHNAKGHGDVPWLTLMTSPTLWMLWVQYFGISYAWYIYITWLPTYLAEHFNLTLATHPILTPLAQGLPLFMGGIGCLCSGFIAVWLEKRMPSILIARRTLAMGGLAMAGIMLVVSAMLKNPLLAVLAMGVASFFNDIAVPAGWKACMDVGGRFAGTVSGSMNMMGNFAGFVCPAVLPYLLKDVFNGDWSMTIASFALAYVVAFACWLFIDPVKQLKGCESKEKPEDLVLAEE